MNWLEFFIQSGITIVLLGIMAFWLKAKIIRAIEKYKESLKWESRRREQTSQIAELISLWIVKNYDKTRDNNQVRFEAQKKYWELALWLEAPVLKALNKAFTGGGAGHYKEAMILARKMIVGAKDDIQADEIVHWDPIEDAPKEEVAKERG